MKITVQLSQQDIIDAIALYLVEMGVPMQAEKGKDKSRIILRYNNVPLTTTQVSVSAEVTFMADHFTEGPFR